jgi:hypothetical protein
LERARTEKMIRDMLWMDQQLFDKACLEFEQKQYAFILQHGHLTTVTSDGQDELPEGTVETVIGEPYQYGITFIPEPYIFAHWAKWFDILEIRRGAIHDFQDIVVLRPRKRRRFLKIWPFIV